MAFLLIIFLCYIVVAIIRKTKIPNEWLPLISGALGMCLTGLVYLTTPSILPEASLGSSVVCGFFCGLAATGSNQVFKQTVRYIANKYGITLVSFKDDDDDKNQREE